MSVGEDDSALGKYLGGAVSDESEVKDIGALVLLVNPGVNPDVCGDVVRSSVCEIDSSGGRLLVLDEEFVLDFLIPVLVVLIPLCGLPYWGRQGDVEFRLTQVGWGCVGSACVEPSLEFGSVCGEDATVGALLFNGELSLAVLNLVSVGKLGVTERPEVEVLPIPCGNFRVRDEIRAGDISHCYGTSAGE